MEHPIRHWNYLQTKYLKTVAPDVLLNTRDEMDNSLLSIAASYNQLQCCEVILERCPSLLYHQSSESGKTALHTAGLRSETATLLITADSKTDIESGRRMSVPRKKLLTMVDKWGRTALHIAVETYNFDLVKLLTEADHNYELLPMIDFNGDTCLHYAVWSREKVKSALGFDYQHHFLRGFTEGEDTKAFYAREIVKILAEGAYGKELLKTINGKKDTPLHLAVKAGRIEIVKILTEADPFLEYFANDSGLTPFLCALQGAASTKHPDFIAGSQIICKLLLEKEPNQCRVQTGDKKWTPLHHATSYGLVDIIKDIVRLCPDCTKLVDYDGQNVVHIAAKLGHLRAVKFFLQAKEIEAAVLNTQDKDGNTPLHVAVLSQNKKTALCLLYDSRASKIVENADGEKAIDLIYFPYNEARAGVYRVGHQTDLKDQSSFDLVVAALIATVSFTAGITVPGGYVNDGTNKGSAILLKDTTFKVFVISNTIALLFSLYTVFLNFSTRRLLKKENIYYESSSATFRTRLLLKKEDIIYQLNVATICTLCAIYALVIAFITGSFAVLAKSDGLAITVCVCASFFLILASHATWRMGTQYCRSE